MLFSWLRRRRRRNLLSKPVPPEWLSYLEEYVPHYAALEPEEQSRLCDIARILVAEKEWEGCGGLDMTDEIKVAIAGTASLLVLHRQENYFDRVISILVYPHTYVARGEALDEQGILRGDSPRLGEAHYRGPVVLSWSEVQQDAGYPAAGKNVVLHEFGHKLDMLNGWVDGIPDLDTKEQYERWTTVMGREFRELRHAAEFHRHTLLDKYGAQNEGEFFAVATECFFLRSRRMAHDHPEMYEVMRDYFRQDPAKRASLWEM